MHTGPDIRQQQSPADGRLTCRWIINDAGVPEMVWFCLTEDRNSLSGRAVVGSDIQQWSEGRKRSADIVAIRVAA
jgi:hypothetical protein